MISKIKISINLVLKAVQAAVGQFLSTDFTAFH